MAEKDDVIYKKEKKDKSLRRLKIKKALYEKEVCQQKEWLGKKECR